jgi:hypothetical protein
MHKRGPEARAQAIFLSAPGLEPFTRCQASLLVEALMRGFAHLRVAVMATGLSACSAVVSEPSGPDSGRPDAATPSDAGGVTSPDAGAAGEDSGTPDSGWDAGTPDAGPSVFVAVGYGGRRLRSVDDGQTWIDDQWLEDAGGDDFYNLRAVGYGGGQFVAVGWRVMTSPDGETWTDHGTMGQWLGGLYNAEGFWVAVGGYGRRTHSTDGVDWDDAPYDGDTRAFRAMAYDPSTLRWVGVGDNSLRASSPDGVNWDAGTGGADAGSQSVAAGGGYVVALDGTWASVSSNGGATWTPTAPLAAQDIAFSGGSFVAVGNGEVFTSTDGTVWDSHPVSGINGAIACHLTTCVVVGQTKAWRSTDTGQSWTPASASAANDNYINAVTWSGGG